MSFTPPKPQACPKTLDEANKRLRALADRARENFGSLSPEQLAWQPAPKAWGVGGVLDHVVVATDKYLPLMQAALAKANPGGSGELGRDTLMGRIFMASLDPTSKVPMPKRVPAPKLFFPKGGDYAGVVERYAQANEALARLSTEAKGVDVRRAIFSTPVTGMIRISLGEAFMMQTVHGERHEHQIARVMGSAGWPG